MLIPVVGPWVGEASVVITAPGVSVRHMDSARTAVARMAILRRYGRAWTLGRQRIGELEADLAEIARPLSGASVSNLPGGLE